MSWRDLLSDQIAAVELDQRIKNADGPIYPSPRNIFRAFDLTPLEEVRVVILGQDPYPNKLATGLAFGVPANTPKDKIPASLQNIATELKNDTGETLVDITLESWTQQGVLLLNHYLTVGDDPESHWDWGWPNVTGAALEILNRLEYPIVFLNWGAYAQRSVRQKVTSPHHVLINNAHPSPLSANRGFLGCCPFSNCNSALVKQPGGLPIEWGVK